MSEGAANDESRKRARAEELAKAHHAEMGTALRRANPGVNVVVGPWSGMPIANQLAYIAAMRALLDKGVIT